MASGSAQYISRRSPVLSTNGSVACSCPLAAQIGIDTLKAGGNAADAAVAVAAALSVTQPMSTGVGGDAFCIYYSAQDKSVKGINGSGRSPSKLTLQLAKDQGFCASKTFPLSHGNTVTVPGAVAAWFDTVDRFGSGKFKMKELLTPAVKLAEEGFPVHKLTAKKWEKASKLLQDERNSDPHSLLLNGRTPKHGEIFKNPDMAATLKELISNGVEGFYSGRIGRAIIEVVHKFGGVMTAEDLENRKSTFEDLIFTDYKYCRVWEMQPSTHGLVALMALNILEGYDLKAMGANSTQYWHHVIEALRLSFSDAFKACADPSKVNVPVDKLLSKPYAAARRKLLDCHRALSHVPPGAAVTGDDTVYFSVVDSQGNACSFINSLFIPFGSGITPTGCGFTLQNRGLGFNLEEGHLNCLAPNKRPYHTIIPSMITSAITGDLLACYGVMGGMMQPQGHVQVLLNMIEFGMDPQEALDQHRINMCGYHLDKSVETVYVEELPTSVIDELKTMGHKVLGPFTGFDRSLFGGGQVIVNGDWWNNDGISSGQRRVYWAGTDPRLDGVAAGY